MATIGACAAVLVGCATTKDLRIHQITVDRQMDSVGERINAIEKKVDTDRAKIYDALSSIRKNLADSGATPQ